MNFTWYLFDWVDVRYTDDPATPLDIFLFLDQVNVSVKMAWAQNMEL